MKLLKLKVVIAIVASFSAVKFAHAGAIITSDLSINAEVEYNNYTEGSGEVLPASTQHIVSGGVASAGNPNPDFGALTNIDDGIYINSEISGDVADDYAEQYFDLTISLTNSSIYDYTVFFNLDYAISATTPVLDVFEDGYVEVDMYLDSGLDELFGSQLVSDNYYGNEENAVPNGNYGGTESAADPNFGFSLTIAAGQTTSIDGQWGLLGQNLFNSPFNGQMEGLLTIVDVRSEQRPPEPSPVPEPSTLLLTLMGIFLIRSRSFKLSKGIRK